LACGTIIRVRAMHTLDNRLVDGREYRICKRITWVGCFGDRGKDAVVLLLSIDTCWDIGHRRPIVAVKVAGGHCCR